MKRIDSAYFLRFILEKRLTREIIKQVGIIDIMIDAGLKSHGYKNLHDAVAETTPQVAKDFFYPLIEERAMWQALHTRVEGDLKRITEDG